MSGRFYQIVGAAVVGGGAYYLYNAGGSPTVAEKKFEADAARLSNQLTGSRPGQSKEVQKDGEVLAADAGKKIDELTRDAKTSVSKVDSKLEGYRKEAEKTIDQTLKESKKEANAAIDSFDKNVTEGASKAKSSVSSWFGGSK